MPVVSIHIGDDLPPRISAAGRPSSIAGEACGFTGSRDVEPARHTAAARLIVRRLRVRQYDAVGLLLIVV